MMTFICNYADVSPAVLEQMIRSRSPRLFCNWWEESEDHFGFRVFTLDNEGLSPAEREMITAIVNPMAYAA